MLLEIWSDYACPYCYIGKRHLEQALAEFEQAGDVQIVFRTFELDRTASRKVVNTTQQRIESKYRKDPLGAKDMINHIVSLAERSGLEMNYSTVQYSNTFDAHRLTHYAETKGAAAEMTERLFRAYFTENSVLADHVLLLQIATELGLDPVETKDVLDSDQFADVARGDETQAELQGVRGVPFFLLEDGTQLSGAQPKEALLNALRTSWISTR
ncbi:Polyketide biosynthesis associated protein [Xenorhabdus poinarii G6]|uniref:Polyketide biosynthesis associated protein n=1 Tax=Xenorhabdus poinarii G6 TaxID=1354304 RepID=A0A068R3I5_9GAMM|nr:DsbA family oxidoreductase [Xenorhabdus poinarii]CDG21822.1 Polyketide biosynthesis associated protein [Xenorhabdus poinarii G6]